MIGSIKNTPKIRSVLIPALIFLVAFLVRLIYLNQIKNNPFFVPHKGGLDDYLYDTWAREIAFKSFVGGKVFWGLPLYPYFLAFTYFLFGHNLFVARLVQFLIGALNCVMVYFMGKKIFGERVGILASMLLAFYRPAIFYEGYLSSSFLSIFLNSLIVLLLLRIWHKPTLIKWLLVGILIGLSGLSNASIFLFVPFLMWWVFKKIMTRPLAGVIVFSIGICLVVGSVTLRNFAVSGDFVPISWHNGITFYSGNNPEADGTFCPPASVGTDMEMTIVNSKLLAEKALNRKLKLSEVSGFWFNQGLEFIKNNPAAYIKLLYIKFLYFWNSYEYSDVLDIYLFAKEFSRLLQLPFFTFGLIAPFAILGMALNLRGKKRPDILLLYFLIASGMFSMMLYFANGRYRLPSVPFLMLFSSFSVLWLFDKFRKRDFSLILFPLILISFTVFIQNIKLTEAGPENFYNNLGVAYKMQGELEKAEPKYKEAIRLKPDYVSAHFNLGLLYSLKGNTDDSIRELNTVIELNPDFYKAHAKLGNIYANLGQISKAVESWKRSLQINPDQPEVTENLSRQ